MERCLQDELGVICFVFKHTISMHFVARNESAFTSSSGIRSDRSHLAKRYVLKFCEIDTRYPQDVLYVHLQFYQHFAAGGSAYGLLFASDGSSAILLAQATAKETNVLVFLPWVSVYYLHREEESMFPMVFSRALHAAAARMNLCPDLYSPYGEERSCAFAHF